MKRPWLKRMIRWSIFCIVAWYAGSLAAVYAMTHRHRVVFSENDFHHAQLAVSLTTIDNETIGGWCDPGQPTQPIILYLHGLGSCRSYEWSRTQFLRDQGFGVLAISLRSHGDSTGSSIDFGYSDKNDVIAAATWLLKNHPKRKIIVWGHSLGSSAALYASPRLGEFVRVYILESPFRDLLTATRNRTKLALPPVLEFIAYAGLRSASWIMLPNAESISPFVAAKSMPPHANVLILYGEEDCHATPQEAIDIHNALGDRSTIVGFPNASHGQLASTNRALFEKTMLQFLKP